MLRYNILIFFEINFVGWKLTMISIFEIRIWVRRSHFQKTNFVNVENYGFKAIQLLVDFTVKWFLNWITFKLRELPLKTQTHFFRRDFRNIWKSVYKNSKLFWSRRTAQDNILNDMAYAAAKKLGYLEKQHAESAPVIIVKIILQLWPRWRRKRSRYF